VLATFGLILFFNELVKVLWGPGAILIDVPALLSGRVELIPGAPYPVYRLVVLAAGLVIAAFLWWLIARTRLGMLIRAGASNAEMVSALGVNIRRLNTLVFGLGAALAGLAEEANPMEVVGARLRLQRDRLALEGPEAVLQRLADELRSRELRLLLARVRAARLGGGSTTEALRAAAADVSAEIAQQVETEIEGAPLRLVFPMLALLLPPLLALVLYPPASLLIEGLTGAGPGTLPGG